VRLFATLLVLAAASPALAAPPAEGTVRLATWNIENWEDHFQAMRDESLPEPASEEERTRRRIEGYQNAEDNWEIAEVLRDPDFAPHVLVFQEGCSQEELDAFAEEWLGDRYPTRRVFPTNSTRGQTLGILLAEGFELVEVRDGYHKMPDESDLNPRSDFLFARGPGFALVEAPSGERFWVGTTHQKSKGGNSVEVARWRAAEASATHEIMLDLAAEGPEAVYLLGDMNDEIGIQEFEIRGGEATSHLLGTDDDDPANDLVLVTEDLALGGKITYTGYYRDRYRSFIDHVVATPAGAELVENVGVYDNAWARVASDHLPVYVDVSINK